MRAGATGRENGGSRLRGFSDEDSYERSRRLDDVLEDVRTAEHPARARRGPRELRVVARDGIERREILVEPEHVAQLRDEVRTASLADRRAEQLDSSVRVALGRDANRACAGPGQRQGHLERRRRRRRAAARRERKLLASTSTVHSAEAASAAPAGGALCR